MALIRFDLMLHKSASYYAIWRRFLHLNEYLRTFSSKTADATIDAHARGLTEHLVQFLAVALEPARVITKVRAPDFLFSMRKISGSNKSVSTIVLDRQGSYTRPAMVRCVCKDEHGQSGRSSPIKMRICNLHFFAPIWMAQPIVHKSASLTSDPDSQDSLTWLTSDPDSQHSLTMRKAGMSGMGRANTRKKHLLVTGSIRLMISEQCGGLPLS